MMCFVSVIAHRWLSEDDVQLDLIFQMDMKTVTFITSVEVYLE